MVTFNVKNLILKLIIMFSIFAGLTISPTFTSKTKAQQSLCTGKARGNANCSENIDLADFEVFRREFNKVVTTTNSDFNSDSTVNLQDFQIWRNSYVNGPTLANMHRILSRKTDNGPEFYNSKTNEKFVARGNNYMKLEKIYDNNGNFLHLTHSTFNVGKYDRTKAESAFTQMKTNGYNIVRVFLHEYYSASDAGGLDEAYLTNLADFIKLAHSKDIYVIVTFGNIPGRGGYSVQNPDPNFEAYNAFYLSQAAIDVKKRWIKDVINGLKRHNVPLEAIFSYNIENEAFFREDLKPLSLTAGIISTADGKSYDMSKAADKQQMMDSNLVHWIDDVKRGIREVDPHTLVGVGFFSPRAVEGADNRIIRTYHAHIDKNLGGSSADYMDLHFYDYQNVELDARSFELDFSKMTEKPILIGEFGYHKTPQSTIQEAAIALKNLQKVTCSNYKVQGWLVWTWNSIEQTELYHVVESNGAINGQLAPIIRPNPCMD